MPKALKVTEKNIENIIAFGQTLDFNLGDIKYDLEDAADYGHDLYVVTDGTPENNNVTFTTIRSDDFSRLWKFTSPEMTTDFVKIERV